MSTPSEAQDPFELWLVEERARRLTQFDTRRPPAFAARGALDPRVHAWLEQLVTGKARTLLLGGRTGAGKTWTCWKSVETLLHNGWRGGWEIVSAYDLARLVAPPVEVDQLDRLARVTLLAVDDLGSIELTDWRSTHMLGLIDYRWSHHLPTMVATNVQDLGEVVGDRIASRLSDGAVSVAVDGPDRRRAQ